MKTWKLIVLVAALLVIVILGAVGGRWYAGNRKPNFTGKADLYVRPQMTVDEVLAKHETILQDFARSEFGEDIPERFIFREVVSGEKIR